MTVIHKTIAQSRWADLSLAEKMGNIGAEISRARSADERNDIERRNNSLNRASDLVYITIEHEKKDSWIREIGLLRDGIQNIKNGSRDIRLKSIEQYCLPFAILARNDK